MTARDERHTEEQLYERPSLGLVEGNKQPKHCLTAGSADEWVIVRIVMLARRSKRPYVFRNNIKIIRLLNVFLNSKHRIHFLKILAQLMNGHLFLRIFGTDKGNAQL